MSSCRPISLYSRLGKLLTRVVHKQLVAFLNWHSDLPTPSTAWIYSWHHVHPASPFKGGLCCVNPLEEVGQLTCSNSTPTYLTASQANMLMILHPIYARRSTRHHIRASSMLPAVTQG